MVKHKELIESLDISGSEKYTGLERDIFNYVRNEIPLRWNESQIDKARSLYGNVPVGTVYHGMKINSEERLEEIRRLSLGSKIKAKLLSATPEYDEAMSYAQYVKSYDERTLMRELMAALHRGSAGKFGTALLTLQPDPNHVIVKTYEEGNEKEFNPNWTKPFGIELEAILYGSVLVKDIAIFEPLTKDNYKDILTKIIVNPDIDYDFGYQWVIENGLFYEDLVHNIIDNLLVNYDATEILTGKNQFLKHHDDMILSHPEIHSFVLDNVQIDDTEIYIDGRKKVPVNREIMKIINPENPKIYKLLKNISDQFGQELEIISTDMHFEFIVDNSRLRYVIGMLIHKNHKLKVVFSKTPTGRKIIKALEDQVKKLVNYNIDDLASMLDVRDDKYDILKVNNFTDKAQSILSKLSVFHPQGKKLASELVNHYYHIIPKGTQDKGLIKFYQLLISPIMDKFLLSFKE